MPETSLSIGPFLHKTVLFIRRFLPLLPTRKKRATAIDRPTLPGGWPAQEAPWRGGRAGSQVACSLRFGLASSSPPKKQTHAQVRKPFSKTNVLWEKGPVHGREQILFQLGTKPNIPFWFLSNPIQSGETHRTPISL